MAATILIGQYMGARRLHDAKRVIGTSTTFAATLSILMAILGWAICEPLLRAMQTPPEALAMAVAYMRVIFLALPFMVLYIFATSRCAARVTPRPRCTSCSCPWDSISR